MSQRAHCPSQVGGHNTGQVLALTHSFVPFQSLGSSNKEGSQCWWMAVNRGLQSYCCCFFCFFCTVHLSVWTCYDGNVKTFVLTFLTFGWMNQSRDWFPVEKRAIQRWTVDPTANAFLQCDRLIITLQVLRLVKHRLILTLASSSLNVIKEFLGKKIVFLVFLWNICAAELHLISVYVAQCLASLTPTSSISNLSH